MSDEPVYSGLPQDGDRVVEDVLRPRDFARFVGRPETVDNLKTWIEGARLRGETLDHILFTGPPGLGKTTLAYIIANELQMSIKATSGPALTRPRDLVGLLTTLQRGEILFIDEIHRLDVRVEEYLYTAMEDFFITIIIDPGPYSRAIRMDLKPFTLIGATTRDGLLTPPLRARFQILERLDFYAVDELAEIIRRSASRLAIDIEDDAAALMATRSRGTPRVANRLLRRVRDVAQAGGSNRITCQIAAEGLRRLGVDERGLSEMDRRILAAMARSAPRPLGLKTIAAIVGEQEDTIQDVYEPFLIREGLLERTSRGRILTHRGLAAIDADRPEDEGPGARQGLF